MISAEGINKSYGSQELFEDASFKINAKERVGLVGRNGHGKTTLFRMIVGEETSEGGAIIIPRNYRIGYVKQNLEFTEDTILKEGIKGLGHNEPDAHWKVEKVLAGLGFSLDDMGRRPSEFSGGFQIRLNLAKVLVSEPDMLLLDEPTNYLDITSIRWIERFLLAWPRELMLITHDRGFMDKVITHTLGIYRKKLRKIEGDTGKYYSQVAQDEEIYEKTRVNDERKRKEVELFISRFRAKARLAGLVQSRVKALEKSGKKEKLERLKDLEFSFRYKNFNAKQVFSARDISFSYDKQTPLIDSFSVSANASDRICIIGKNGRGKTTLLRLMAGSLEPDNGEISFHNAAVTGVYEQTNLSRLADSRTVEDEILYSSPDVDRQLARNICGTMLFEGDDALKKIQVLSGGEKSRVMLGKILATPVNVLLLDEPTNHLDMESCDALLAAIDNFDGTVIMVTHNEMFLHALAQRLIVFDESGINVFEGGYEDFLGRGGWGDEETADVSDDSKNSEKDSSSKKETRRRRSEIITERSKILKPLEQKTKETEDAIEKLEQEMKACMDGIDRATANGDGRTISGLSQEYHEAEQKIEKLFDVLDKLAKDYEAASCIFDEKLAGLDYNK